MFYQRVHSVLRNFNPLSPCGERLFLWGLSILGARFQSTLPVRGETYSLGCCPANIDFNPLSPCGERRDFILSFQIYEQFQSTLPVRGETQNIKRAKTKARFQSTLPVRGETGKDILRMAIKLNFNPLSPCGERLTPGNRCGAQPIISIHSPRAGRDFQMSCIGYCD